MSTRTFKLTDPHMHGSDVEDWQAWLKHQLASWDVDYPLKVDGDYGQATRSATASVCHGLGLASASSAMADGVTPELRTKLRNKRLTDDEKRRYDERAGWRRDLAKRYAHADIAYPAAKVSQDSWGYHPGVHDGIDLICPEGAALVAICKATVIRADASGWWGLGAPSDPKLKARGDGIIILRSLVDVGPIRKGMNFGYGHAEHAAVKAGETVSAGEFIGKAGFANAGHVHFMVNMGEGSRGVGDRDPRPIIDYVRQHA